jgi:hypothetical protein
MAPPIEPKPSLMGSPPLSPDSSDWSDALACPIVPLAMQILVGTANKDAGKCPPMRIQRAKSEAEIMKPIACRAETMERRLRAEP